MGLVREVLTLVSIVIAILAYLQFKDDPLASKAVETHQSAVQIMATQHAARLPTYFFSHGGVSTCYALCAPQKKTDFLPANCAI